MLECKFLTKRWFVETPASFLKQNKQRKIFGSFDNARCKCDTLSQKRTLLEAFVAITSYVPKYARWLLNHAKELQQTDGRSHLRRYGPEVQYALFLV
jgi:hypothetical protein